MTGSPDLLTTGSRGGFVSRLIKRPRARFAAATCTVFSAVAILTAVTQLPAIGAGGLLHPVRRPVTAEAPGSCVDAVFAGAGVQLKGWRCPAAGERRGSLVYLHGVADNRASAIGVIGRFTSKGFDVLAYDSRGHGESAGEFCSYGFFEKDDLRAVLDTLPPGPIVLIGSSLGGAIALQEAASDPRITAVVAAETFSDLRTIAHERSPFFFTDGLLRRAFAIVEERGGFRVDEVSPVIAATRISAPVLLIHGEADIDTPPAHSQRVFAALKGPRRLLLVPGAAHNTSLTPGVWAQIEEWLEAALCDSSPRSSFHKVCNLPAQSARSREPPV